MMIKLLFFCDLLLILFIQLKGQQIGEECIVKKTDTEGICTKVYSCNDAVGDWKNKTSPTLCDSPNIVCCPLEEEHNFTRISEQKCAEYASAVFRHTKLGALDSRARFDYITKPKCEQEIPPLSESAVEADTREFPHMALIGYGGPQDIKWMCGGALISENYVLTAAHCRNNSLGFAKYARFGRTDGNLNLKYSKQYDIYKIIVHELYSPSQNYHDIALMQVFRKVEFTPYIRPACLPTYFDEPETAAIVTGYGANELTNEGSHRLFKAGVKKMEPQECQEKFPDNSLLSSGINHQTQICVETATSTQDPCSTDSGSPLQIYHHCRYCMYTIIGVNSFGSPCGSSISPVVYTRVSAYLNWIQNKVWSRR